MFIVVVGEEKVDVATDTTILCPTCLKVFHVYCDPVAVQLRVLLDVREQNSTGCVVGSVAIVAGEYCRITWFALVDVASAMIFPLVVVS